MMKAYQKSHPTSVFFQKSKGKIREDDSLSNSSSHSAESTISSISVCSRKIFHDPSQVPPCCGVRLVFFREQRNIVHDTPAMTEEECDTYWYSADECNQMKLVELSDCKQVLASVEHTKYLKALTNVYHAKKMDTAKLDLFQEVRQAGSFCIGLEQRLVKSNARDKPKRRQRLVQIASNVIPTSSEWDRESLDELLRVMCIKTSQPAVLFALAIGQAQAQMES